MSPWAMGTEKSWIIHALCMINRLCTIKRLYVGMHDQQIMHDQIDMDDLIDTMNDISMQDPALYRQLESETCLIHCQNQTSHKKTSCKTRKTSL